MHAPGPAAGPAAGGRAAGPSSAWPTPPTGWSRPGRAACAGGWTWSASLIVAPPVLFLDEPTTGLDPRSRAEIWAAVRGLAAAGTTVLLSHPVPGRGRPARRRRGDHRRRPGGRAGHPRRAQGRHRHPHRHRAGRRRRPGRRGRACWPAGPPARPVTDPDRAAADGPGRPRARSRCPSWSASSRRPACGREDVSVRRPTLDEVFLDRTARARGRRRRHDAWTAGRLTRTARLGRLAGPADRPPPSGC